jgi:hypothetical protein
MLIAGNFVNTSPVEVKKLNIVVLNQTNLSDAKDTIFSQGNYYKMFYDILTIITKLKVPQLLQNDLITS